MSRQSITRVLFGTVVVLTIPLIASIFVSSINWSFADYLIAGVLLSVAGFGLELVAKKVKPSRRPVLFVLVVGLVLVVWVEMAVGLFGTPIAGS